MELGEERNILGIMTMPYFVKMTLKKLFFSKSMFLALVFFPLQIRQWLNKPKTINFANNPPKAFDKISAHMTNLKMISAALLVLIGTTASVTAHEHKSENTPDAKLQKIKSWFETDAIVSGPDLVDCTLSAGSKAKCFSITVHPDPSGMKTGPWLSAPYF